MGKRPKFTQPPTFLKKKSLIQKIKDPPSPFLKRKKTQLNFKKNNFPQQTLIDHFTILKTYLDHVVFKHVRLCGINLCNGQKRQNSYDYNRNADFYETTQPLTSIDKIVNGIFAAKARVAHLIPSKSQNSMEINTIGQLRKNIIHSNKIELTIESNQTP